MASPAQSNSDPAARRPSSAGDWTAGAPKRAAVIVLTLVALAGAASSFRRAESRFIDGRPRAGATSESGSSGVSIPDGRLDINRATAQELTLLPAIGPALAARIVADREEHGFFTSTDELGRVSGIGPRTLAKLLPFVVVREDEETAHPEGAP